MSPSHRGLPSLLLLLLVLAVLSVSGDNVGWKAYLEENTDEFHDLKLTWETGSKVPSWLSGTYVRNGPAQISFQSPRRVLSSWLDGWAKLHSFKFSGDTVLFSGKMLESPNYLASLEAGELVPQTTLNKFTKEDEEWSFWEKLQISYKVATGSAFDNNNPVVWRLGQQDPELGIYLAMTDSPVPTRFNISDLSTLGMEYPNWFPLTLSGCAHYLREVGTDNSISFMRKKHLTGKPFVEVQRYRTTDTYQEPEVVATFVPRKYSNIHSFSITEDSAIFFFYPVIIDAKKYYSANFHVFELLEWLEGEQTDVYVVNLRSGNVTHFQTDPTYSVHHVNAYNKNKDEIILDLCPTPFINMRDYLKLENMMNPPETSEWVSTNQDGEFTRYTINTATGDISTSHFENKINSRWINQFDFPVINERYRGKEYCVVYGWTAFDYSRMALVKKNVCDETQDKVWHVENHYSSEMWFIEAPEPTSEDDGILLTLVFDGEREKSYLLLLDARTFQPVATSYLPRNIPWSAHGMHFPEATLKQSAAGTPDLPRDEL